MLLLTNRATVGSSTLEQIAGALEGMSLLEHVVRWGFGSTPARQVLDVVVQDEFTHDVVVGWDDRLHLVFDTT